MATVDIDAARSAGPISPLLYGQFVEFMFEGIKRGLHAELIRNRGFDEETNAIGLSRHWERYPDDRNDDYGMAFSRDGSALRVQLRSAVVMRHGIHQPRIPIRQGVDYHGYLWMKAESFAGDVNVALEADAAGGRIYGESSIAQITGDWKKYTFTLRPSTSDPLARFAILFNGAGTVWVDHVSLMPSDAVDGVRADVLGKVKALAPAFVRWPGGNVAQDYRWQWGVGPRDERPVWVNLSWKNEPEPSDFGTDEFVQFARNAGAEPSITVNVEGRGATADEAAQWVHYCNRSRAYGVKYWEIGNEIWGDWVRGHSDAETYARNLIRYVGAMRAVDPAIKVIAVGDNDMAWNRTVLQLAAGHFDYLAVHHYYGQKEMAGDLRNLMARPLHYERWYGEVKDLFDTLPADRRPKLAINEWGLDLPESQQYSIVAALYGARLMNVFERQSGLVAMSAVSDLVNGWPGGIIQASAHGVFVTPIYLVNQLYATHLGAERLAARSNLPALDVVASHSRDGRTMFLKAVNTDLERPLSVTINVRGRRVLPEAVVERVVADSLTAMNGFATPEAVKITRADINAGNTFTLEMPRHSVAVVTLKIEE